MPRTPAATRPRSSPTLRVAVAAPAIQPPTPPPRGASHARKKYRVAVIGRTGKGNYGHGLDTVWLKCDRAEIVAVADENEAGRAAAAKRLGAKAAYADYREMLAKEKPQIVSVADRWPDCHRDMVVACAEHGASIFLEKPVARTLQEADEMVAACEKHHVKCAVAHQTRYSPRVKVVEGADRATGGSATCSNSAATARRTAAAAART